MKQFLVDYFEHEAFQICSNFFPPVFFIYIFRYHYSDWLSNHVTLSGVCQDYIMSSILVKEFPSQFEKQQQQKQTSVHF